MRLVANQLKALVASFRGSNPLLAVFLKGIDMRKTKIGKTEVDFFVTSMKPLDFYTKAFRFFDLLEEESQMMGKVTKTITVTWERGQKVTKARIEKTRKNIIKGMEEYGFFVKTVVASETRSVI